MPPGALARKPFAAARRALLLAISLLTCPAGHAADDARQASALTGIVPESYPLQRKWVSSAISPWRLIGRINLAGRGFCTGTLVSPTQVLTAAHCLWNQRTGRWFPPQYITFVAGAEKDSYQGYAKGRSFQVGKGFIPHARDGMAILQHDWALLELETPLGDRLGYLSLAPGSAITTGREVIQAGYRIDRPYVLTVEQDCQIEKLHHGDRIMQSTCRTNSGDSGGPLLIRQGTDWLLIGLHRGRLTGGESLAVSIENFKAVIE